MLKKINLFFSTTKILPKIYHDACIAKPQEYYDYKNYIIKYG